MKRRNGKKTAPCPFDQWLVAAVKYQGIEPDEVLPSSGVTVRRLLDETLQTPGWQDGFRIMVDHLSAQENPKERILGWWDTLAAKAVEAGYDF